MTLAAMGVVIPARDEELLLGPCLDAVAVAVAQVRLPVVVVVVLDSCLDASARVAARHPEVVTVTTEVGCVGAGRRLGTDVAMAQVGGYAPESIWLANTDADSTVPPDWLRGQVALAAAGWDVVIGTVAVEDWTAHHSSVPTRWTSEYVVAENHPHVHGANLGVRASTYLDAGGWPPLAAHEDVELVRRLGRARVLSTATLPVVTSARRDARCSVGFGDTVAGLVG